MITTIDNTGRRTTAGRYRVEFRSDAPFDVLFAVGVNSQPWRGHAAHTLLLHGVSVEKIGLSWIRKPLYRGTCRIEKLGPDAHLITIPHFDEAVGVIHKQIPIHDLVDFNALPIGEEIRDER